MNSSSTTKQWVKNSLKKSPVQKTRHIISTLKENYFFREIDLLFLFHEFSCPFSFRDSKDDSSHTFKLVMVGDSGVGKSCLLEKFIDLSSNNAFISTIGVDVRTHVIKLDGQSVKLQVISRVFFHQKKKLVKTHYF